MMFQKLVTFFVLGFTCIALNTAAQPDDINFTSITTREGLSSNTVNVILKDRLGLVWFGTEDGLNCFDGVNITVYRHKPNDPKSLPANEILALYEDKEGNLWIGTSGGSLSRFDRRKNVFTKYPAGGKALTNNVCRGISSDDAGNIWIVHFSGVDILNPKTGEVSRFSFATKQYNWNPGMQGKSIFRDRKNRMWIGTAKGLFRYDLRTKSLERFFYTPPSPAAPGGLLVNSISEDATGNIWVGTETGLYVQAPGSAGFVRQDLKPDPANLRNNNFVNAIAVAPNQLWVGTGAGLDILDTRTGTIKKLRPGFRNTHSLRSAFIRYVYVEPRGSFWLGTTGGGVNTYDPSLNLFNLVQSNRFDRQGLSAPIVTAFAEGNNNQIYVGTEGGGLSLFNPNTKAFQPIPLVSKRAGSESYLTVTSLKMTRNKQLLVGSFAEGLFILNPETGGYTQLLQDGKPSGLNGNEIYALEEDHNGQVWVGTNGQGLNVLNAAHQVIARFTPQPKDPIDRLLPINGYIRDIKEDRKGDIWIATHGGGIAVYHPRTGTFNTYHTENSKLPNDKVCSLLEDASGNIWAGTLGGGLAVFSRATGQFSVLSEKDSLPNSTVYKLLQDQNGTIWISTNKGISSISPATKWVRNYTHHNGLQNNNFVSGAGLVSANGALYFGGRDGFNFFNPKYLKRNNTVPPVLITDLKIAHQSVSPSEDGPLQEDITIAKEINLDYKQNFALSYVGLNYTSPEQNQYAYKLEGFEKDWNYVGSNTSVSYTNLDPGEYTFRVKASNNDGVWNEQGAAIRIYVHPPFWLSGYAYFFYLLVIGAALYYSRQRAMGKLSRKLALEQERFHAEQERKQAMRIHELDQLKIKFLTNLSHEFRTPISLILGPIDRLLDQEQGQQAKSQLQMVRRNAKRLMNLVNQLLDFRKMEEKELTLQESEGELGAFVKDVYDTFKDLSERKKIDFVFSSHIDPLYTRFDHDKLERILFNLLSNAFKFTPTGGRIDLVLVAAQTESPGSQWMEIKVSDTGTGISENKQGQIFERFFQENAAGVLNQGTGIGLAITREFVQLHGGTIDVESQMGKGSTFTVRLPFTVLPGPMQPEKAETPEANPAPALLPEATPGNDRSMEPTTLPTILLVEDNEDFLAFMKDNLEPHYKVYEATNGKEGWQKALALHPQLIISDINMPEMDGVELTRKIKGDKRTNHIPVILLTALTGEEDQLNGLQTGANDYISKHFNYQVLHARIKNLLLLNNTLKSTYTRQLKVSAAEPVIESDDEKLLHKIMVYLEENLTNPQLSVEEMSRNIGMSRSSLYNKLLELTGQTPVEFIRSVKLEKALVLLEKSDLTIAQVAYSVGFSTPNYFAKSFKAKYNMLPSEYIAKTRNEAGGKGIPAESIAAR